MSPRPMRGAAEGGRARRRAAPARPWPVGRAGAAGAATGASIHAATGAFGPAWREESYLALDFETTGLDSKKERVVEIGALLWRSGRETAAFQSLVQPGIHIPSNVVAIHGISDRDVLDAPRFESLGPVLMALAAGSTIVAHNAPFDLAFLRGELARAGLPPPANRVLDTRILAKAAFPGLPSYSLGSLAAHFGLETGRAHRALDDARTCLGLLILCAERLSARA